MIRPLTVVEIQGRSEQGMTRPFHCRCDDGNLYFVKGRAASQRSLICEWLGGNLAKAFGLPIPEFTIAQAAPELLELHPEGRDLGSMPLFASRKVEHVQEFSISHLHQVDDCLQRDVLAFDWWINNGDRTLTAYSGNPNLLWSTEARKLVVIDQNLAFDPDFDPATFSVTHVFAGQIDLLNQDLIEPQRLRELCGRALAVWADACKNVPQEWQFVDEEQTVPTNFDPDAVLALLNRYSHEDFWRMTPWLRA
ncbi:MULTISPECIES: HipA family kinase [Stenotrophomonas]|jgi:hypothetical protein|uniref:HipA family kinase n=1 Tax=Stenotrophomonas TaxID=40323 RepID=UPI00201CD235|nr:MULTISPECIES: HipA family kinase [Stenotrophomonas]MDQ1061308.1 hypothetical protein [Stenotrophomonas sp. SORGH_AS_0282]MDQ1190343.1 hypothetical protein [Stenotrophomonas sp. SORGH_AS_0282]UQY87238.1 hypothetical protein LQE85_17420 [Stenotrophomonas rhizophila]